MRMLDQTGTGLHQIISDPAAAIDHIPSRRQQIIRYFGPYSNNSRSMPHPAVAPTESSGKKKPEPKPPKITARAMRPLWRDLILRVWGADPLECPCCKATTFFRPAEIEFFLRLHGLWE